MFVYTYEMMKKTNYYLHSALIHKFMVWHFNIIAHISFTEHYLLYINCDFLKIQWWLNECNCNGFYQCNWSQFMHNYCLVETIFDYNENKLKHFCWIWFEWYVVWCYTYIAMQIKTIIYKHYDHESFCANNEMLFEISAIRHPVEVRRISIVINKYGKIFYQSIN